MRTPLYRLVFIFGLLSTLLAAGTIGPSADIAGKSLEEAKIQNRYDVIVLAIQRLAADGMEFNPSARFRLEEGDTLIVMGDVPNLKRMESDFER